MSEDLDAQEFEPTFIDIPPIFYSDLTDRPIERCVNCDKDLLHGHEPYILEKAFKRYPDYDITNTIFEYAMCMTCAQEMHQSMSKESLQKIQEYFADIDFAARSAEMKEQHQGDFEAWIGNCVMNGASRNTLEEYQICAQCIGDKLVFDVLPYMMSHEASDEVTSLLSAQTLEEYNRFVDDNFGLPPEFKKALKDNPVLVT